MKAQVPIYISIFIGMVIAFLVPTKLPYLMAQVGSVSLTGTGLLVGLMGCCSAQAGIFYGKIAARMLRMQVMFRCFPSNRYWLLYAGFCNLSRGGCTCGGLYRVRTGCPDSDDCKLDLR